MPEPFTVDARVRMWDAALGAVRKTLGRLGYREVTTPTRQRVPIPEPYIEPLPAPPGYLVTSPEQGLKRLLGAGAGPIFEVARVFRAGERGDRHREEFHLVEWYRPGGALVDLQAEVVELAGHVFEAVAPTVAEAGRTPPPVPRAPVRRVDVLDALARAVGAPLRGNESAADLVAVVRRGRADLRAAVEGAVSGFASLTAPGADLAAWTALFSWWADGTLEGSAPPRGVVHLVRFPGQLAALARTEWVQDRYVAHRFETAVDGVEIANGYDEERSADALGARFEAVHGLRAALDLPPLPPADEVARAVAGIGPTVGVAFGLDRAIMLAAGTGSLDEVGLHVVASPPS